MQPMPLFPVPSKSTGVEGSDVVSESEAKEATEKRKLNESIDMLEPGDYVGELLGSFFCLGPVGWNVLCFVSLSLIRFAAGVKTKFRGRTNNNSLGDGRTT
jgi:hypothetical protein